MCSGVVKDFLRELPEPLFTNTLYPMLVDALSVRSPADPDGSAKLMLSILECLPRINQVGIRLHSQHNYMHTNHGPRHASRSNSAFFISSGNAIHREPSVLHQCTPST